MSDPSSSNHPQPDPAEMTVFQWMSRQTNYRTMRASERIREAWNKLPLFAEVLGDEKNKLPGIQSIGFIRRAFKDANPPPFNSSMARAKRFNRDAVDGILTAIDGNRSAFEEYLAAVEKANPSHPSVRRAARYFRDLLNSPTRSTGTSTQRLKDVELERVHHHGLELYRRLPYTKVLNEFIYPLLCPTETPEHGPKALLFDAAWHWARDRQDPSETNRRYKEEPLPRFVKLAGAPDLESAPPQHDFDPFFDGPEEIDEKTKQTVREWHNTWFRSIEATEGLMWAGDFLILAVPIREGWQDDAPFGSYLGHLALFLRRDRFFSSEELDEKGPIRMSELADERRKKVWSQMVRFWEGLTTFLNGKEWISPLLEEDSWFADIFKNGIRGQLHWEAMRRDLDDFVDAHYESEFDEWLDIEFHVGAGHADVQNALKEVAANTDGWREDDCSDFKPVSDGNCPVGVNVEVFKIYLSRLQDYHEYFQLNADGTVAKLKLQSETREPGRTPDHVYEFCLKKIKDTIIPPILPPDGEVRIKYFRRLHKRYNHLYQRFLRRAEFAAAGKQSGFLESAHDYSKDVGSACLRLLDYSELFQKRRASLLKETERLSDLPEPAGEVAKAFKEHLAALEPARLEWFAATRFTYAHLQAHTTGALVAEPIECVRMLETGTLRSVYEIVRCLVWLPLHYAGYKELEQKLRAENSPDLENPLTWCALFSYDMRPNKATEKFHKNLGERIMGLFLKEVIEGQDFVKRFRAPEINPGTTDFAAPLLWKKQREESAARFGPIERLLPLFVYSLRFAFQCAWARALMIEKPGHRPPIGLGARNIDAQTRQIFITFDIPVATELTRLEAIPYYMEWRQQMNHYNRAATFPWKPVGPETVTLDSANRKITICLTATV
jgi:hypothetical protein